MDQMIRQEIELYLKYANQAHTALMEDFLELKLPVQVIAHLEFPHRVPREIADDHYRNFVWTIQRHYRVQVGSITGYEHTKNVPLHLHSALIAPRSLDVRVVTAAWWLEIGKFLTHPSSDVYPISEASLLQIGRRHKTSVKASVYEPGQGGLAYVLKAEDEDRCEVIFSDNLHLFNRQPELIDSAKLSARERRMLKRILANKESPNPQSSSTRHLGIARSEPHPASVFSTSAEVGGVGRRHLGSSSGQ